MPTDHLETLQESVHPILCRNISAISHALALFIRLTDANPTTAGPGPQRSPTDNSLFSLHGVWRAKRQPPQRRLDERAWRENKCKHHFLSRATLTADDMADLIGRRPSAENVIVSSRGVLHRRTCVVRPSASSGPSEREQADMTEDVTFRLADRRSL